MGDSSNGRLVLVVLLATLAMPMLMLLGLTVGTGLQFTSFSDVTVVALWVNAIATLLIAVLTFFVAKETWQLRLFQFKQLEEIRKASVRPEIDVSLNRSKSQYSVMDVVIENLGVGMARKVRFEFEGAAGTDLSEAETEVVERLRSMAMFREGLKVLGAQKSRRSHLFVIHEIFGRYPEDFYSICINISAEFEDADGVVHKSRSVWDFGELEGTSEIGYGDPISRVADELKELSDTVRGLGKINSGTR
ncbi:MAG: hypothetical protein KDI37_04630 [Xanthomonadales bacterium]|nr:hypothetical protein [Xanthomonadales bacterium]